MLEAAAAARVKGRCPVDGSASLCVSDTFYGFLVQILIRSPPQYEIFGLNTSHKPLPNPVAEDAKAAADAKAKIASAANAKATSAGA